jgi:THO complex subunit 2
MLLCLLVKEMDARGYVDGATLRRTLELNLLVGAGICRDEAGLQKRLVKLNTTMVYRQQKYNLLREETEGFSKLLTVLSTLPCPPHDPALQIKQVFSIIGYFDLDPNRVIDIILEVMEQQIWNTSFLTLLKSFRKANVCHIVGFKLSHYRDIAAATEGSVSAPPSSNDATVSSASLQSPLNSISTPPSLYMLIAVLLSEDMIDIEGVLPYLSPTLLDIAKNINAKSADLKKEILMYGVVNLSAKSTPVPPVPPVPPPPDARKVIHAH